MRNWFIKTFIFYYNFIFYICFIFILRDIINIEKKDITFINIDKMFLILMNYYGNNIKFILFKYYL